MTESAILIKNRLETMLGLDLSSKLRDRDSVEARAVFFKLVREKTDLTLSAMGKLVNRDHATALHGIRVVFPSLEYYNKDLHTLYLHMLDEDNILANINRKVKKLDYDKLQTLNTFLNEITN